jgi:uncharacterized membrane protein
MRSMSGPAVLAARGEIPGRLRPALLLAGAGEVAADKSSRAPDRTAPPALAGRIGTGAYTGYAVGGPVAAVVAALSAAGGTYATYQLRQRLGSASGLPDPVIAVGEDVLCYLAAALATRDVGGDTPAAVPAPATVPSGLVAS